jgi:3-phenylpropionate/trans-cinnamate dioxygenase ferredoxin reductase subunit
MDKASKEQDMPDFEYLIVGGGMTADAAVRGIREVDAEGSLGLISLEPDPPYNRPPLSKALWKGKDLDTIWRRTDERDVELILGTRVTRLDPKNHVVEDKAGQTYGYGKLLLALGGKPRRFPFGDESIVYFRNLRDYRRLRELADEKQHFAVIGGGFIGSEIAAALAMNDRQVTMLFPETGIGAATFPADLSDSVNEYYRQKGVDVRTGVKVADVRPADAGVSVQLDSGDAIQADAVVAGIGIVPNTALAADAGLVVDSGIVVDGSLRTSQPDIYAAGDVASFHNPALGERMRVEHEDNANTMGQMAGRAMAGDTVEYSHLPFFYSDLFELGYEAVGILDSQLETIADWEDPFRKGIVYYLKDGRVRGVLLWDVWGKVDQARSLIAEPGPFDAASLKGRLID